MNTHWTERSTEDYLFRIGADFIDQLENKMEALKVTQNGLAEKLRITKGRVSQVFNHPGNITLSNIVKYSRAVGLKVSIVAYDDGDSENKRGPINSEVFRICWVNCGKPSDLWALQQTSVSSTEDSLSSNSMLKHPYLIADQIDYTVKKTIDSLKQNVGLNYVLSEETPFFGHPGSRQSVKEAVAR